MNYIIGSIFYVIAFVLIAFVAPQKSETFYGHRETFMNIPTMFYATWNFIIGTMFFTMGYIKGLLNPTSSTEIDSSTETENTSSTEIDSSALIIPVLFVIFVIIVMACAWLWVSNR